MKSFQESTTLTYSAAHVYEFLVNLNNHEKLMPSIILEWKSDQNTCSFSVKGILKLSLKIAKAVPNTLIEAIPTEAAPLAMNLRWEIEALSEMECKATYTIEAELNMMMLMVAKPILNELVSHEIKTLKESL